MNSHQPKGCFLSDRQKKSPEFYALKNAKKKAYRYFVFFGGESDGASQHRRPQKGKKIIDFDFCQFFCIFGSACSMRF
jgi:hypothetical protein